ncbi:MAG: hypoxanthine phosphoribosyltransferase [Acidobacteriota bacterium]
MTRASFPSPASPRSRRDSHPFVPGRIVLDAGRIRAIVARLGDEIHARHAGQDLTVIAVLDGALMFTADLLRHLPLRTRLQTVRARSYRGDAREPGPLEIFVPDGDVTDRHVLLVDDILDTGRTLHSVVEHLMASRPASIETCVLLDKPVRREIHIQPDWVGARIADHFVVGYGLDHDGWYRNLPHIAVLEPAHPEQVRA